MQYTVYKITNKINNKTYIGCHQTENLDDGYMGSGKLIKRAIAKYGVENFDKEILTSFEEPTQMFDEEKNLISTLNPEYNIHEGGDGGFGHVNSTPTGDQRRQAGLKLIETKKTDGSYDEWVRISTKRLVRYNKSNEGRAHISALYRGKPSAFAGRKHSEESKRRMSRTSIGMGAGEKNSQYGTMWITDGTKSTRIKKTDIIPEGWYRGRIIKGV